MFFVLLLILISLPAHALHKRPEPCYAQTHYSPAYSGTEKALPLLFRPRQAQRQLAAEIAAQCHTDSDASSIRGLIQKGADLDTYIEEQICYKENGPRYTRMSTPLWTAIEINNTPIALALIEACPHINQSVSCMEYACFNGNFTIIQALWHVYAAMLRTHLKKTVAPVMDLITQPFNHSGKLNSPERVEALKFLLDRMPALIKKGSRACFFRCNHINCTYDKHMHGVDHVCATGHTRHHAQIRAILHEYATKPNIKRNTLL